MSLNLRVTKKTLHFTKEKKEVYVASPDRGNVIDAEKIADLASIVIPDFSNFTVDNMLDLLK